MNFVVKNTTKWQLIDLLCPHICRGCGRLGEVLCECCKNNILEQQKPICPLCKMQIALDPKNMLTWQCEHCKLPGKAVFVGGWREGALGKLIHDYKYEAVWAAGRVLAEIMDKAIPMAECWTRQNIVIVPLPTIGKHVRERGIDHTYRLAKELAKLRGWRVQKLLARRKDTVQVGTKAAERQKQAAEAYTVVKNVDKDTIYLLLDDVWTTGASMMEATKVLEKAGATEIYGAVLATSR